MSQGVISPRRPPTRRDGRGAVGVHDPKNGVSDQLLIATARQEAFKAEREARRALASRMHGNYIRESFTLPPAAARLKVREILDRHPYRKFGTTVERWRWLKDGQIEFTVRRMPTAHWRADLLSHLTSRTVG